MATEAVREDLKTERYDIVCYNCKNSFDAHEAVWCNCVAVEATLVCPSCLRCFCKAPKDYVDEFWSRAPQTIWDRKLKNSPGKGMESNPDPATVSHPIVLIVDDEPLIRKLAMKAVQSCGYTAITAADGVQAIDLVKTYKPELILSDMLMPKLEGTQLCHYIKSNPETQNIKVVLMTSLYTKSRHRVELSKYSHPDDYLSKPLDFQKLHSVLIRYLEADSEGGAA